MAWSWNSSLVRAGKSSRKRRSCRRRETSQGTKTRSTQAWRIWISFERERDITCRRSDLSGRERKEDLHESSWKVSFVVDFEQSSFSGRSNRYWSISIFGLSILSFYLFLPLSSSSNRYKLTPAALDVARALLSYDPRRRASAKEALEMEYFTTELPVAERPAGWVIDFFHTSFCVPREVESFEIDPDASFLLLPSSFLSFASIRILSAAGGEWHEYESRLHKKSRQSNAASTSNSTSTSRKHWTIA